jgi:rhodanese-related sulfurtransferase
MQRYKNISIFQAQEVLTDDSCIVLDIRDDRSYAQGHLAGARRFDEQTLRWMRKAAQRHAPVLVYCYHGNSSKDVAQLICEFGFSNVFSMDGGYTAWEAAEKQAASPTTTSPTNSELGLEPDVHAWLVEQGITPNNINERVDYGMTALMQACRYGKEKAVKSLLQAGADIHLTNHDGNNALWLACFSGNAEIIDVLLNSGIDINNQNLTGATALMYSASAGKAAVVKKLLEAGADPHLVTQDDFTALDLAASPQAHRLLRNLQPTAVNTGAA